MALTQKSEQNPVKTSSSTYKYTGENTKKINQRGQVKTKSSVQPDAVLGYDISLIKKDLLATVFVTLMLVGILFFLAWYLPIGILSS